MWFVYPFLSLYSVLTLSTLLKVALIPGGSGFMCGTSSSILRRTHFQRAGASAARSSVARRFLAASTAGAEEAGGMVPDDAAALLRAVYEAKPKPQICVTTTG